MIATALAACGTAIASAGAWLDHIFSKLPGASSLLIVGVFIFTAVRLLLRPIVRSASSDHARRFNRSKGDSE